MLHTGVVDAVSHVVTPDAPQSTNEATQYGWHSAGHAAPLHVEWKFSAAFQVQSMTQREQS